MATYKDYTKGTYKDSDELVNAKQQNSYYGSQQLKDFAWDNSMVSSDTKAWYEKLNSLQKPGEFAFSSQQDWDDTKSKLKNMKGFSYDLNGDALYQQYKDQYITGGKMAMMDTMGQAAAMTGGYGNSYAQSVGQQAYQGYLQGLNDKVPELYQLALSKYYSDRDDLYRMNDMYQNLFTTEYGQHRDKVNDYNTELDYLTGRYDTGYERDYKAALDANTSYNSNLTSNRDYWSGREDKLTTRDWNQYTGEEAIKQAAVQIANDTAYRQNQLDFAALEKQYEGYMSPEDVAAYQKAENSEQTKLFQASLPSGTEWRRFSNGDGTYTYDGKRYDSKESVIGGIIDRWVKEGKLTPAEEAWLKGYYDVAVD